MADASFGGEIIRVVFYDADIEGIAEAVEVDIDTARERVAEWAGALQDMAIQTLNEALAEVIETGQP